MPGAGGGKAAVGLARSRAAAPRAGGGAPSAGSPPRRSPGTPPSASAGLRRARRGEQVGRRPAGSPAQAAGPAGPGGAGNGPAAGRPAGQGQPTAAPWLATPRARTLGDVNDEQHHVDDLHAADDGPDQRRVAGAVDERELQLVVRQVLEVRRQRHLRRRRRRGRGRGCGGPGAAAQAALPPRPRRGWQGHRPAGARTMKEEKPRSSVMPRSLLCGCLSSAAVDSVVDSAATSAVLPESTWPSTPTLMLRMRGAGAAAIAPSADRGRWLRPRAPTRATAVPSLPGTGRSGRKAEPLGRWNCWQGRNGDAAAPRGDQQPRSGVLGLGAGRGVFASFWRRERVA